MKKTIILTIMLALITMTGQAQSKIGTLAETMWRNEQTGDWDIGFTEKCAIYDCRLWDYSDVRQKGDKFDLTLTNDGESLKVSIGKQKDGKRQMTIETRGKGQDARSKKQLYSLITTDELPNYPTKDLTPFKDNGYRAGDTVTFIGWLKNFPKQVLDKKRKYEISVYSIITREGVDYTGDIDDEGHFVVKVPVENSQQVYADWGRTNLLTVLEPGETYFLLMDAKSHQRLIMGRNARVQNELLAHEYRKAFEQTEQHGMTEEQLIAYKDKWAGLYQHNQAMLDSILKQNPTLSQRFEDYHRMGDACTMAEEVMQSSLFAEGGKLPKVVKDYVDSQLWPNIAGPYTIAREMIQLLYYYSSNAKYGSNNIKRTITINANSLLQMEKDGLIKFTDEDREVLRKWQVLLTEYQQAKEEDYPAISEKNKELEAQISALFNRSDVQTAINDRLDAIQMEVQISDSIYADPVLRDFSKSQKLYERLDHRRQPLNKTCMAILNTIQLPAARNVILAENDKFINMQKAEVEHSECLRPSSDVEGLTDGEAILRKILEPFKGRIVYMDLWGTWCGPCKEKLKESHHVKEQLKQYDIVYLYLANRSPEDSWKNVIKEYKLTGPNCVHYNLPEEQQAAIEQFLKVDSFPTYKLIDKQGNIHDLHWLHAEDMNSFLETIDKLSK
jgi:thiol-disulfide isomerase/thioredoxin